MPLRGQTRIDTARIADWAKVQWHAMNLLAGGRSDPPAGQAPRDVSGSHLRAMITRLQSD
jgi:hypothetical protein